MQDLKQKGATYVEYRGVALGMAQERGTIDCGVRPDGTFAYRMEGESNRLVYRPFRAVEMKGPCGSGFFPALDLALLGVVVAGAIGVAIWWWFNGRRG